MGNISRCHGFKQGSNKPVTDALPPTRGREKGGKGRETYKLGIKSFTNNTNNTNNINNKSKLCKIYKTDTEFPGDGCRALASCQQLPGSTRPSWTGLGSRQGLDSGRHRLESGSGSHAGQGRGSSLEAGHGQRERNPRDPPALN